MQQELLMNCLGFPGAMISGSKSGYRNLYPDNFAIFNANVVVGNSKVWYGDLDLTKKKADLLELAESLGEPVYVLFEMDGRFEYETSPRIDKAAATFMPDGTIKVADHLVNYTKSFTE